jgi:hypothetical protein
MGDTVTWIHIEIAVFWFNIILMAILVVIEKYLQTIKSKLFRFKIQKDIIDEDLL